MVLLVQTFRCHPKNYEDFTGFPPSPSLTADCREHLPSPREAWKAGDELACLWMSRLRVVSNFGNSDGGAGENKHARTREIRGRRDAKGEPLPSLFRPPHARYRQN